MRAPTVPGSRPSCGRRPRAPAASRAAILPASVEKLERDAIVAALNASAGNQTRAAEQLGISRRALIYKMKKLGVHSTRVVE